ncbi:MAG TPA: GntR family transcriptional regulator [Steroidobacteraceae bacterium]|jgi:GntR family transcriptional regulator|nr:GntR family transcriptional regulator [Steroidobacteraceae bacterium]
MGSASSLRIFTLQPSSGVPIYLQLIQQVRRMVASGQLAPGTELPSVRDVATDYTVNPTTISKAYSLLENEGLLQRNRGKPMTIAGNRHGAGSLAQRLKQVEPQVEALALAARQLQLRASDLCLFIEKKMGEDA